MHVWVLVGCLTNNSVEKTYISRLSCRGHMHLMTRSIWATLTRSCLPKNANAFKSQSCRKHKKTAAETNPNAEFSHRSLCLFPLCGTVRACSHCGDFMAFNQTQRLHYGSVRWNKLTLPPIPFLLCHIPLPPPLHVHTFTHICVAKRHIFRSVTSFGYQRWEKGEKNADKEGRHGTEVGKCVCDY